MGSGTIYQKTRNPIKTGLEACIFFGIIIALLFLYHITGDKNETGV